MIYGILQATLFCLFECDGNNNEKELDAWERKDKVMTGDNVIEK